MRPPPSEILLTCEVPGCEVSYRQTTRRPIRTCPDHRQADVVTLQDGLPRRFCQQCSRLHPLDRFNGDQRACARRLDVRHHMRIANRASAGATTKESLLSAGGSDFGLGASGEFNFTDGADPRAASHPGRDDQHSAEVPTPPVSLAGVSHNWMSADGCDPTGGNLRVGSPPVLNSVAMPLSGMKRGCEDDMPMPRAGTPAGRNARPERLAGHQSANNVTYPQADCWPISVAKADGPNAPPPVEQGPSGNPHALPEELHADFFLSMGVPPSVVSMLCGCWRQPWRYM